MVYTSASSYDVNLSHWLVKASLDKSSVLASLYLFINCLLLLLLLLLLYYYYYYFFVVVIMLLLLSKLVKSLSVCLVITQELLVVLKN